MFPSCRSRCFCLIWITLTVLMLVGGGSQKAVAQSKKLDPALKQAAKEYDRAQIAGDRKSLERLVADDYLIIRGNGSVENKAFLIDEVAHEGLKTDPFTVVRPFIRIYSNTAILGGWVHLAGIDRGKPYVQNFRFADTWARRNGRWQVVFTSVILTDKP